VAGVVAPIHVARQRYLVALAAPTRPKDQIRKIFSGTIIIKILNKIRLKNNNSSRWGRKGFSTRPNAVGLE
jgi:hypothetical protein